MKNPNSAKSFQVTLGHQKIILVVGNGSDELIDRIIRLFVEKGEVAVSFAPTFSIPRLCVKRQEGEYISVPLQSNLQLDVKGMLAKFSRQNQVALHLLTKQSDFNPVQSGRR